MAGKMVQKARVPAAKLMSEFNFWDPHDGKKEPTFTSCPLTSSYMCVQTNKNVKKGGSKTIFTYRWYEHVY